MFQFPGFARHARIGVTPHRSPGGGLPHSDIRGSRAARASPRLFAASHVLPRLRQPRHPPRALPTLPGSWYPTRVGSATQQQKRSPVYPGTLSGARSRARRSYLSSVLVNELPSANAETGVPGVPSGYLGSRTRAGPPPTGGTRDHRHEERKRARTPSGGQRDDRTPATPRPVLEHRRLMDHLAEAKDRCSKRRYSSRTFRYGYLVTT